ncbi:MAG: VWA domain-containing protein [Myxococcota bacterium]|nr:VWA domain-containing protein [Myxococcota bacterium]
MNRTAMFLGFAAVLAALAALPKPTAQKMAEAAPTLILPSTTTSSTGAVVLSAKLGATTLPASITSEVFARFELQANGERPPRAARGPVSLAVALDRSGSMSGQKLYDAKRAVSDLIERLQDGDRFALAHYGSDVTVLPPVVISPATRRQLLGQVEEIRDYGGTNLSGGLEGAFAALQLVHAEVSARRLILVSDGQPTEGSTDLAGLTTLTARIREQGVAVSALGIGSDFNDTLMRQLANHGGGFYAHLGQSSRLGEIFARELDQATNAVAQGVKLRLMPAPGVEIKDVSGFPFSRDGDGSVTVQVYDLAAAQNARVLVELSVPPGFSSSQVVRSELSYWSPVHRQQERAALQLVAARSDDPRVLAGARDAEVYADSLRVIGGREIARATAAYERGDRALAGSMFDNVRRLFGSSADALAGESRALDESEAALRCARSGEEVRSQAMQVRKNLSHFGVNNAY